MATTIDSGREPPGSLARSGRFIGMAVAVLTVAICIMTVLDRLAILQEMCRGDVCAPGQLTPSTASAVEGSGISLNAYATGTLILDIAAVVAYLTMAGVLLWRKGTERMALIVSLFFCGLALDTYPLPTLAETSPTWADVAAINWSISIGIGVVLFAATFPTGSLVPRWARWVLVFALFQEGSRLFFPANPVNPDNWPESVQGLELLGWILLIIGWQVYRYRRVSTIAERQQTKWVVFAFVATLLANLAVITVTQVSPDAGDERAWLTVATASILDITLLLTPLAISVAILKYRLFDIDRLIRRTLVYGLLTTLLAGLYFALVSVLSVAASGQSSPLVVAASTLGVAGAFQPLRKGLKNAVDRRFDRRRYDAIRTLEEFSTRMGHETDLETLLQDFAHVVDETMRPASMSIWSGGLDRTRQATGR